MDNSMIDEAKRKVEAYKSEVISITSRLIQFPTVSPPSDTFECTGFIKSYFEEIGLKTTLYERKKDKTNLHVRVPGRPNKTLIWLGHLDVVPIGLPRAWTHDPFGGEVTDGRIYGRGASDMKGSCAAAMVAAKVLSEIGEDKHATVDFWFTCDEEVGSPDGARWLVEGNMLKGDECIIGDAFGSVPNKPWIDVGCKGYMRTRIKASGKTAHGSMPFRGDNAIDKLMLAVEKAKQIGELSLDLPEDLNQLIESSINFLLMEEKWTENQRKNILRVFRHPTVSLNLIKGGVKVNVVPDYAEATFDIRITPGADPNRIEEQMFRLLKDFRDEGIKVKTLSLRSGYYEKWDSSFAKVFSRAVELATGIKPLPKIPLYTTDALHVKQKLGIPCLGFGAGTEDAIHAPDEYVTFENLLMAAKVYSVLPIIC